MKAVHFGAGNIGRGFIGLLLHQSGYQTTFIDVNEQVIEALNEQQQYKVVLAADESHEEIVKHVSGINSMNDPDQVVQAISEADIITTAIGPNVLPLISELLAKGLLARMKQQENSLYIIACENMVGGSSFLKEKVIEHIPQEDRELFNKLYHFPDAAVDRIVPNQENEDILKVIVEPYYEWVVEDQHMAGNKPDIQGITYVNDLTPYIERKLFTVNTGHIVAAYVGNHLGHTTIKEAMNDQQVELCIKGALKESGEALVETYGFDEEEHQQYIDTIIERFLNPHISDEVMRVGRGPLRKLGKNDRLIRPATLYTKVTGREPTHLATAIAAGLHYVNDEDEEAVKLQKMIEDKGYRKTLQIVSDLGEADPLIELVIKQMDKLVALK